MLNEITDSDTLQYLGFIIAGVVLLFGISLALLVRQRARRNMENMQAVHEADVGSLQSDLKKAKAEKTVAEKQADALGEDALARTQRIQELEGGLEARTNEVASCREAQTALQESLNRQSEAFDAERRALEEELTANRERLEELESTPTPDPFKFNFEKPGESRVDVAFSSYPSGKLVLGGEWAVVDQEANAHGSYQVRKVAFHPHLGEQEVASRFSAVEAAEILERFNAETPHTVEVHDVRHNVEGEEVRVHTLFKDGHEAAVELRNAAVMGTIVITVACSVDDEIVPLMGTHRIYLYDGDAYESSNPGFREFNIR